MSDLKTLKDIDGYHIEFFETTLPLPHNYEDIHGTNFATLKQEAIKWVKSRNTGGFTFAISIDGKVIKHNKKKENLNSIDWANLGEMIGFINFFNITEEDLK